MAGGGVSGVGDDLAVVVDAGRVLDPVAGLVANPLEMGGLRLDPGSADPAYRQRLRDCFYGDVDPATADAAIALLTPDAPAGIAAGATALTADGWGYPCPAR